MLYQLEFLGSRLANLSYTRAGRSESGENITLSTLSSRRKAEKRKAAEEFARRTLNRSREVKDKRRRWVARTTRRSFAFSQEQIVE
jgi:hypothetical protein